MTWNSDLDDFEEIEVDASVQEKTDQFLSPIFWLKLGLASVGRILLIGAGLLINFILGLAFLWSNTGSWSSYLWGVLAFFVLFPLLYGLFALYYGRGLVAWEFYQRVLRPFIEQALTVLLNHMIRQTPDGAPLVTEERIVQIKHFFDQVLSKLPHFLRKRMDNLVDMTNMIVLLRQYQPTSGTLKEGFKSKVLSGVMGSIDAQATNQLQPSYLPALVIAGINLIVAFALF